MNSKLKVLIEAAAAERLTSLTKYMSDKERQKLIDEGRSETFITFILGAETALDALADEARLAKRTPKIIEDLDCLIKQAAVERSHYYVKSVCEKAQLAIAALMAENARLEAEVERLKGEVKGLCELNDEIRAEWNDCMDQARVQGRQETREELARLRANLEFYADRKSWQHSGPCGGYQMYEKIIGDGDEDPNSNGETYNIHGGKRARQALAPRPGDEEE